MAPEETCKILLAQFGEEAIVSAVLEARRPFVQVTADHWPAMALFLRDDERCRFNVLRSVTALDLLAEDRLACIYDLLHVRTERPTELIDGAYEFAVRVEVDRNDPVIGSVAHVWPAADWHEREAFDLMGIRFSNHPDLRRILCPDDWVGHPLRKDYDFPLEYHGIPGMTEYDLTNPRH